eukprot:scaffold5164_cov101-Cylindrotheca_fusiformis.AAC.2
MQECIEDPKPSNHSFVKSSERTHERKQDERSSFDKRSGGGRTGGKVWTYQWCRYDTRVMSRQEKQEKSGMKTTKMAMIVANSTNNTTWKISKLRNELRSELRLCT